MLELSLLKKQQLLKLAGKGSLFMVYTVRLFLSVLIQDYGVVLFFVSLHHNHRVTLCDTVILQDGLSLMGKYHGIAMNDNQLFTTLRLAC